MNNSGDIHNISAQGEIVSAELSFSWVEPGPIEAGESIAPAKLKSEAAPIFAALHLILSDLKFSEECLNAANSIGLPNDSNLHSKALIFAGVVSYARCFKSGVRAPALNPSNLQSQGVSFNDKIHDYLVALRDKHIAHSVNDFEGCEAVAIMIGKNGEEWRYGGGIGVVQKQSIGITQALIIEALAHIASLRQFLEADLSTKRTSLHLQFQANFQKTGKWEIAPVVQLSDRSKITERRR